VPYKNDTGKHIYLNADKTAIAEEGSPEAAFLLVGPGGEVSDADAVKYGLMDAPKSAPSDPRAVSRVEHLQAAHDAAMERGATEEARVHRANLEAAQAEEGVKPKTTRSTERASDADVKPAETKAKGR
jgi:hypothetical protein